MHSLIYQFALVLGLSALVWGLLKGLSISVALTRAGMVLLAVLLTLFVAGNILRVCFPGKPQADTETGTPQLDEAKEQAQDEGAD